MSNNKISYVSMLKAVNNFRASVERNSINDLLSNYSLNRIKVIIKNYNDFISATSVIKIELARDDLSEIEELDEKKHLLKHAEEIQVLVNKLKKSLKMKAFW